MILSGKGLRSMKSLSVEGEALVTKEPITFLGFVDKITGNIVEEGHDLFGQSIKDKIFIFPRGIGSTVAPYVLINLQKNKSAPKAIINRESDSGTVAGASASRIPMVYKLNQDPLELIKTGDKIMIKIDDGVAQVSINE